MNHPSPRPLRALVVEDSEADYELLLMLLAGAHYALDAERVEDEASMRAALAKGGWDLVISDHSLPSFSARAALETVHECGTDIPFLIVSGAIGEDAAVDAMLAGADDYIMKSRLSRLVPAIERSLRNAEARRKRRDAEAEVLLSREELRALSAHLERVKEEERARIAREIHDDIGGTLTGLKADLAWLGKRFASDPPIMEKLASMGTLVDAAVSASQRIARDLRPALLDYGFVAAIQWQAQDFQRRTGVRCRVECEDQELDLAPARATAVFRIFQELLTNVTKHAEASEVAVRLVAGGGELVLEVNDNGRGITEADERKRGSYGIRGMKERARELGGRFEIAGQPAGGTAAMLSLPLEDATAERGASSVSEHSR
jgi:two-component system, NarL family, sensor histidine kinase UhpB